MNKKQPMNRKTISMVHHLANIAAGAAFVLSLAIIGYLSLWADLPTN